MAMSSIYQRAAGGVGAAIVRVGAWAVLAALAGGCESPEPVAPPEPEPVEIEETPPEPEPEPEPEIEPLPVEPEPEPVTEAAPREVRAALLLPLTGPRAAVGAVLADAAQLALFDHADANFILLPKDTGGTPEGAVAAMQAALTEDPDIVLGPLLAAPAHSIAPLAREAGVPVIAFTNDRRAAGGGIHVMGLTPDQQVRDVVGYALATGSARFGLLAPVGPYGDVVVTALHAAVARYGGAVGEIARVPPDDGRRRG